MSASASIHKMLNAVTATGAGSTVRPSSRFRTYQASVAGTGAVSASVLVEVTNEADPRNPRQVSSTANYITLATIALSGTDSATDGFESKAAWAFSRMRVSAISGTGATVNGTMAVQQ